jgi:tRNA (guanosine-2'-O-)-methyltransferase
VKKKTIVSKTGVRAVHRAMKSKYEDRPEICYLAQDWEDGYNVGSLFRLAEAAGAAKIVLTGKTPIPEESPMIGVTSMGQHRRVKWSHSVRHDAAIDQLKSEGWSIVAVEIAEGAVDVFEFEFPDRICFVLGNEGGGVYGNVMSACDAVVFIPMFGKGRSLNVTSAASVVTYAAIASAGR